MRYFVAGLILFFSSLTAHGIETYPQFRGLDISQSQSFDRPGLLDSEYSSDVLTYLKPLHWEYDWLQEDVAFDLTTGSLSSKHFYVEDRLKLRQFLVKDKVEFRFTHFTQGDLEEDVQQHVLEMVFWPWAKWGLAVYGETSLYKSEDNVGMALVHRPNDHSEHRLYATYPDFSRNKRNGYDDFFAPGGRPEVYGLYGEWWSKDSQEFYRYSLRYETPVEWIFPSKARKYLYERSQASFWWQKEIHKNTYLAGRIQYDRKNEGQEPQEDSSPIDSDNEETSWERQRHLAQIQWSQSQGASEWTAGLAYFYRDWFTDGKRIMLRDVLPHFWWAFPKKGTEAFTRRWHVGYEMTYHRGTDPDFFFGSDNRPLDHRAEHRLNTKYQMSFDSGRTELSLYFTFDLDEFGGGETWEGGAAKFRTSW